LFNKYKIYFTNKNSKIMKTMKNIFLALFLVSAFVFTGCNKDDDPVDMPEPTNTIVDIASADANFSILVDALIKADLAGTLAGSGTFTVFAPTNDAFNALFTELGVSGLSDLSAETLKPILLYHVMGEEKTSGMLSAGYYASMSPAQGSYVSLYVQTDMGVKLNNRSMVTSADIDADNGVIHVIDKVLLPPTVVDIAAANSSFSTLVDAVVAENLATTLSATDASYTVFAPTNAAFAALGTLPSDLTPILLYHVLGDAVFSTDISSSIVNTLNSTDPELVIEVTDNGVMLNGVANVVSTDIVGVNGVIHVIDAVITPIAENSILDIALANGFTSLSAALAKVNLATTFMESGAYTVFAPTNDAFAAFLSNAGFSGLSEVPNDVLTNVLLYHVVGAEVLSTGLSNGYVSTLLTSFDDNAVTLLVDLTSGVSLNSSATVTTADVDATNGVIHIIDEVLSPPSVVDIAINNPNFSTLVEAVVKAELVETLSGEGPFTVFAPTNDAFDALFADLGVGGIADLTKEQLVPILTYHVVADNVLSTELADGSVATVNGANITIAVGPPATINTDSEISAVDVQGTNGVVHVISKVLLPPAK
jgi:transforming growth factor-beta-induced protein